MPRLANTSAMRPPSPGGMISLPSSMIAVVRPETPIRNAPSRSCTKGPCQIRKWASSLSSGASHESVSTAVFAVGSIFFAASTISAHW